MPRRLTLALILFLALSGATMAASTCPDPFPAVGYALQEYLVFPVHAQVRTLDIVATAVRDTPEQLAAHIEFTPQGHISLLQWYYVERQPDGKQPYYQYRATFDASGRPAGATFTLRNSTAATLMAKLRWQYQSDNYHYYGDLYVRLKPDDPLPTTPNYRLVPNYKGVANYAVYRPDGTVAAVLWYEQLDDCSIWVDTANLPAMGTPEYVLTQLFDPAGLVGGDYSATIETRSTAPGLILALNPDNPDDLTGTPAWQAVAKDSHGNVTRYTTGELIHQFNTYTLNGPDTYTLRYTYY